MVATAGGWRRGAVGTVGWAVGGDLRVFNLDLGGCACAKTSFEGN